MKDLIKRYKILNINRQKICGYLADYEIDKAIENEEFNFIANVLIEYFDDKDVGYLLTKFEDSGLSNKLEEDEVDFSLKEWYDVKNEISEELRKNPSKDLDKDEYLREMIKKRNEDR